ncbi:hypothetical protein ACO0QE_003674 [Hanseniaspora vineae]
MATVDSKHIDTPHENVITTDKSQIQSSPLKNDITANQNTKQENENVEQDNTNTVDKQSKKWTLSQDSLKIKSFTGYTLSLPQWQSTPSTSSPKVAESSASTTTSDKSSSSDKNKTDLVQKSDESDKKTLSKVDNTNSTENNNSTDEPKIGDKRKPDHGESSAKKIAVSDKKD